MRGGLQEGFHCHHDARGLIPRTHVARVEQAMKITRGHGVTIHMTGDEVATAIDAWLIANGVQVTGARTIFLNGQLCKAGEVYVDPTGKVHNTRETGLCSDTF